MKAKAGRAHQGWLWSVRAEGSTLRERVATYEQAVQDATCGVAFRCASPGGLPRRASKTLCGHVVHATVSEMGPSAHDFLVQRNIEITNLAGLGRWRAALEALRVAVLAVGLQPDQITFGAASRACERVGRWEAVLSLLLRMQLGLTLPDQIAHSISLSACAKDGLWQIAAETLSKCRERGLRLNTVVHSACVSACQQGSEWSWAFQLLREMQTARSLNLIAYSAAIGASQKSGQWLSAVDLFAALPVLRIKPNQITYGSLGCSVAYTFFLYLVSGCPIVLPLSPKSASIYTYTYIYIYRCMCVVI